MKLLFLMGLTLEAFICLATAKPAQESIKAKNAVMQERMRVRMDSSWILKKGNEESKVMRQNDRGGDFPGLGCDDDTDLGHAVKMNCAEGTDGGNYCTAQDAAQQPVVDGEGRWGWTEEQATWIDRFVRTPARAEQNVLVAFVEGVNAFLVDHLGMSRKCGSNTRSCRSLHPEFIG